MYNRFPYWLIGMTAWWLVLPVAAEPLEFRDPFHPTGTDVVEVQPAAPISQGQHLLVQAVFGQDVQPERRRALVNGKVLLIGDAIGAFTLLEIDRQGILRFRNDETGEIVLRGIHADHDRH